MAIKITNLKSVIIEGVRYEPVVISGRNFTDAERTTSNIREVAKKMGFIPPPMAFADNYALADWEHLVEEPQTPTVGGSYISIHGKECNSWKSWQGDYDKWRSKDYARRVHQAAGEIGFLRKAYPPSKITQMGFDWLVIMHEPIISPPHADSLFTEYTNARKIVSRLETLTVLGEDANWYYNPIRFLHSCGKGKSWYRKDGFVFLKP